MRMPYIIFCCVLLFSVPVSVYAQQSDVLSLEEYAKGVGGNLVNGKWVVTQKKSAMGDRSTVFVRLLRDGGSQDLDGSLFGMLCKDNETGVVFGFSGKSLGNGEKIFEYKIDDQPIKKENWLAVDTFMYSLTSIPFLKSLVGKKRLAVRGYPADGGSVEMVFDIEGIERVLPLIQIECGWK